MFDKHRVLHPHNVDRDGNKKDANIIRGMRVMFEWILVDFLRVYLKMLSTVLLRISGARERSIRNCVLIRVQCHVWPCENKNKLYRVISGYDSRL